MHSPGKWEVFVVSNRNFNAICEVDQFEREPDVVIGNAHLLAASADLLEACEIALAAYDEALATGESRIWSGKNVDLMRAAVTKAKRTP